MVLRTIVEADHVSAVIDSATCSQHALIDRLMWHLASTPDRGAPVGHSDTWLAGLVDGLCDALVLYEFDDETVTFIDLWVRTLAQPAASRQSSFRRRAARAPDKLAA